MSTENIRDYGAVGDGITDDTAAVNAATLAAGVGGVVYAPPGVYRVGTVLSNRADDLTFLGEPGASSYKAVDDSNVKFQTILLAGYPGRRITFQGLTFDRSGIMDNICERVVIRNCRFVDITTPEQAITSQASGGELIVEDCEFTTSAARVRQSDGRWIGFGQANGITARGDNRRIRIRRNTFRWLYDCIQIGSLTAGDTPTPNDIVIEDNNFDSAWWFLPIWRDSSNVKLLGGAQASYAAGSGTAVTVTDPGITANLNELQGPFGPGQPWVHHVHALVSRNTGTVHTATRDTLITAAPGGGSLLTDPPTRGDVVYAGTGVGSGTPPTHMGLIADGPRFNHRVPLDGWLNPSTYEPIDPPAASTPYVVYRILVGHLTEKDATNKTLTTDNFHTLDGLMGQLPALHTPYEVAQVRNNYVLQILNCSDVEFRNNRIRGWYSDFIHVVDTSSNVRILGNDLIDGQDFFAVTFESSAPSALEPVDCVVAGNTVRRPGTGAFWMGGTQRCVVRDNIVHGPLITENNAGPVIPVITLIGDDDHASTDNIVEGNVIDAAGTLNTAVAADGIGIHGDGTDSVERNTVARNRTFAVPGFGLRVSGTANVPVLIDNELDAVTGEVSISATATAGAVLSDRVVRVTSPTGYTLQMDSRNGQSVVYENGTSNVEVVIPDLPWPLGYRVKVARFGTGFLRVVPAAGVTIHSARDYRYISPQWSSAELEHLGNSEWLLSSPSLVEDPIPHAPLRATQATFGSSGTSVTSPSFLPEQGSLLLVSGRVSSSLASDTVTMTSTFLTIGPWTVAWVYTGNTTSGSLWVAAAQLGAFNSYGTVTATWQTAGPQRIISVDTCENVSSIGTPVVGTIGTTGATYSIAMGSTPPADSVVWAALATASADTISPDAGYIELGETTVGSPVRRLQSQYDRASPVNPAWANLTNANNRVGCAIVLT